MMAQSVLHGLLTAGAVTLGSSFGALATMALYLLVTAMVALPWTLWLFRPFWRRAPDAS